MVVKADECDENDTACPFERLSVKHPRSARGIRVDIQQVLQIGHSSKEIEDKKFNVSGMSI